uniref:Uncharacterized protein n=1 Tax=Panagrolaimus superbus TaxID=310955 RepID=A0A914YHB5_9BILA
MQLIGKLYRANGGWQADWVFVDNGRELNKWTSKDANAMRAMAAGADGAADALVKRYAKAGVAVGQAGTYRLVVTGINSADDYLRLAAGLREVPVVRNVTPLHASAGQLELSVEMTTGLAGFNRMLGDNGVLVPSAPLPALPTPIDDTTGAPGGRAVPAPAEVHPVRRPDRLGGVAAGADPDPVRAGTGAGLAG